MSDNRQLLQLKSEPVLCMGGKSEDGSYRIIWSYQFSEIKVVASAWILHSGNLFELNIFVLFSLEIKNFR